MTAQSTTVYRNLLHSELEGEDIEPLLLQFLEGLPNRFSVLEQALSEGNWDGVKKVSHAICGAAGSYGYPTIADEARHAEEIADTTQMPEEVQHILARMKVSQDSAKKALLLRRNSI
jgi:HPt (histidine-containing phosphotransfer) domain-containing protein